MGYTFAMSDTEIVAILHSIDRRLGGVETRLGGVETRLGGVETGLGGVGTRLGGVENRLGGMDERLNTLETNVARQPDLRLLGHQMATLIERVAELNAMNLRTITAVNDLARENVTPGEIEALHGGLKEVHTSTFRHEARIRRIEAELHLPP